MPEPQQACTKGTVYDAKSGQCVDEKSQDFWSGK